MIADITDKLLKVNEAESLQELQDIVASFDSIQSRNNKIVNVESKYWASKVMIVKNQVDTGVPFDRIQWNLLTRTYGIRQQAMYLAFYQRQEMVSRGECNF